MAPNDRRQIHPWWLFHAYRLFMFGVIDGALAAVD
jgi:hypothetical protein